MLLSWPGRMFHEDLVTTEWTISASTSGTVPSHITVRVPDIITVFLVECVVGYQAETAAPVRKAFREGEAEAFEKEGKLEAGVVF